VKRSNEFAVGLAVIAALALVIGGALWLSQTDINQKSAKYVARFRDIGGLGVGAPVTLRGVKVGRVEAIRLGEHEWVETDLTVDRSVKLPKNPAVITSSSSLFGEWQANIVPLEPLPDDPALRAALLEGARAGGDKWPGGTLPDIGQLTAQANRIANDVADVTDRVRGAFDTTALRQLRTSVRDLAAVADRLVIFANAQTNRMERVGVKVESSSNSIANVAATFERAAQQLEAATRDGQLKSMMDNGRASTEDIRAAAADLRSVMASARSSQGSLVRVIQSADSLMYKIQSGQGTLGMLANDSTLYRETTLTMRQFRELLTDIQAHPRKYLKVSVF
jgi:phospholipid/cholesterol/gamma-HCH transport system substrate-binding protein